MDAILDWTIAQRPFLYHYVRRRIGEADAEDIVQEVMIRALRPSAPIDADRVHQKRWLLRVARNLMIDRGRRLPPITALDEAWMMSDGTDIEHEIAARMEWERTLSALNRCTPKERAVLRLAALSIADSRAAQMLGIPSGTQKSRLWRARQSLRRAFEAG